MSPYRINLNSSHVVDIYLDREEINKFNYNQKNNKK